MTCKRSPESYCAPVEGMVFVRVRRMVVVVPEAGGVLLAIEGEGLLIELLRWPMPIGYPIPIATWTLKDFKGTWGVRR